MELSLDNVGVNDTIRSVIIVPRDMAEHFILTDNDGQAMLKNEDTIKDDENYDYQKISVDNVTYTDIEALVVMIKEINNCTVFN